MEEFIWFLATLAVASLGMLVALKLRIPCAGIIGAMSAVILLNFATNGSSVFYDQMKIFVQITVGAIGGAKVGREELRELKSILKPIGILFPLILLLNIVFGYLIYLVSDLDAITAFFCVTPGGMSDIPVVAAELGADSGSIAIMHVLRVIVCNAVFPSLFIRINSAHPGSLEGAGHASAVEQQEATGILRVAALVLFSSAGGLAARALGIKGGAIIGSMAFSIIFSCIWGKTEVPIALRRVQQLLTGSYVGCGIHLGTLLNIKMLLLPMALSLVNIFGATFLIGYLVYRTHTLDKLSSYTCSAPGGAAEMILVTDELGGDVSRVGLIHSIRVIYVVTVFPGILYSLAASL